MCLPATIVPRWHERELLNPVFQIGPHAIFLVDAWRILATVTRFPDGEYGWC